MELNGNVNMKVEDLWFYLPFDPKKSQSFNSLEKRLNLVMFIYKWLHVEHIPLSDVESRTCDFISEHWNLTDENERLSELGSYWGAAWLSSYNSDFEHRWLIAEPIILNCKMKLLSSFTDLLENNGLSDNIVDWSEDEDNDLLSDFQQHNKITFKVPFEEAHLVLGNKGVHLIGGFAYITEDHLSKWIEGKMYLSLLKLMRTTHPFNSQNLERMKEESKNKGEDTQELALFNSCNNLVKGRIKEEDHVKKLRFQELAVKRGASGISDIEDLCSTAKNYLPPCKAMEVFRAKEKGIHPKFESRKQLIFYLFSLGYQEEEIDEAIYQLWKHSKDLEGRRGAQFNTDGSITRDSYYKLCKDVKTISDKRKNGTEYHQAGCTKLKDMSNSSNTQCAACPIQNHLNYKGKFTEELKELLKWMGVEENRISKIISKNANFKHTDLCTEIFSAIHKDTRYKLSIRHPNFYFKLAINTNK